MKAKKIIIYDYCKGCHLCINFCPKKVLKVGDNTNEFGNFYPVVDKLNECIVCRLCEMNCPDSAIDVESEEDE